MRSPEQEIEFRETELLRSRVRTGLVVWIGAAALFVVSDLWLGSEESGLIQIARAANLVAVIAYFYLRKWRERLQVERAAVATMMAGIGVLALSTVGSPDPSAALILSSVMTLGAATVLPWRFGCQLATVGVEAPALAVGIVLGSGELMSAVSEPMLGVYASFGASLYIARILETQRLATNQAMAATQSDARVSSALARVGRELIESLDEPALLQRLCALTSEVFACGSSYTFLIGDDGSVTAEAGHSFGAEEWETMRALRILPGGLGPLPEHLRRSGFAYWDFTRGSRIVPDAINGTDPVTLGMYFALRKGGDLVGFQAALFRGRTDEPTLYERRVGRGLSDLASLALETARLLNELESANRFQSEFLANMSHELRTPLNVIIGYTEMLSDGAFGEVNGEQQATIGRIQKNAREQLGLITATLQLSRFESSEIPLDVCEVDVDSILEELESEAKLVARCDSLKLVWDLEPDLPSIRTDVVKLRMVLKNLIDNAVKFTDEGEVTVRARRHEGGVGVEVEDTGPGIPAEALGVIFEAFRQHNTSETQGRGGVGIGLYLVKRLVGALRGTVDVESQPGRGTKFTVWIPEDLDQSFDLRNSA